MICEADIASFTPHWNRAYNKCVLRTGDIFGLLCFCREVIISEDTHKKKDDKSLAFGYEITDCALQEGTKFGYIFSYERTPKILK